MNQVAIEGNYDESLEKQRKPTQEQINEMIKRLKEEHPSFDDEICYTLLEDCGFNLDNALVGAFEMESLYNSFQNQDNDFIPEMEEEIHNDPFVKEFTVGSKANFLHEIFPNISFGRIQQLLNSTKGDLQEAADILANGQLPENNQDIPHHIEISDDDSVVEIRNPVSHIPVNRKFAPMPDYEQEFKQYTQHKKIDTKSQIKKDQPRDMSWNLNKRPVPEELQTILSRPKNREDNFKSLIDVFPDYSYEAIENALDFAKDDLDRASFYLIECPPVDSPINPDILSLREMFPAMLPSEIHDAYIKSANDITKATSILLSQQCEDPSPVDLIIAMYPRIPIKIIRSILDKTNGDMDLALKCVSEVPTSQYEKLKHDRKRIITVDLHHYTSSQAQRLVLRCLQKAPESDIQEINFITGRGMHSKNKKPILRPLVLNLCKSKGIKAEICKQNNGVVSVDFSSLP